MELTHYRWPEWRHDAWAVDWEKGGWLLMPHPAFWHCAGGLPVRGDRYDRYVAAARELMV